jgi:hypothetical protein
MQVENTKQMKRETDLAASERSASDDAGYTLSQMISKGAAVVDFQGCESFTEPPFDRCHTPSEKRRMFASMLVMAAVNHLPKLSAPAVASNIGYILDVFANMKEYSPEQFAKDSFLENVSLPLGENHGFLFGFQDVKKGQLFHYDSPQEKGYGDIPRLGYFNDAARYPVITRDGKLFCALDPQYLETMKKQLPAASGDVLILGLKMGVYPYLVSGKDSVRTVTIIEQDPDVIAMFEEVILPQIPHAEKIIVLQEDPLAFVQKEWKKEYNFVLSCTDQDSLKATVSYLTIKQTEKKHKKTKFAYWIEESILSNIKSALLVELMAQTSDEPERMYRTLEDDEEGRKIFTAVHPFMDTLVIRSPKELQNLFNNRKLSKRLAG